MKLWKTLEHAGTENPADDFEPYLELYLLDGMPPARGAVIVCPGGAYRFRAQHEAGPIAQKFNDLGFHAFVLQYRVSPYRFPAPQRDLFRAIRLVRSHAAEWQVNPGQIAVLGFSAGGHLAASAGTLFDEIDAADSDAADICSQRPDALILCYPVISFGREFGHRGSGENLLGSSLEELEDRCCLNRHVTSDTPPTFLWHTATDGAVPVRNSLAFAEACWENSVPAELHVFPSGPHGVGLALNYPDVKIWPELAAKFLTATCGFAVRCRA